MTTPAKLRNLFRFASGLRTNHAAITRVDGNLLTVEFSGFKRDGKRFHIRSSPFAGSIARQVKRTAVLATLQRNSVLENVAKEISFGERPMAQLSGNLASHVRDSIQKRKQRSAASHEAFGKALQAFDAAHDNIDAASNAMEKEAAELLASMADFTNSDGTSAA